MACKLDRSTCQVGESGDSPHQRLLPVAFHPGDTHDLTRADLQIDAIEGNVPAVRPGGDGLHRKDGRAGRMRRLIGVPTDP
ncbi:hypothetical protein D9M72_490480 [compost metagenome]